MIAPALALLLALGSSDASQKALVPEYEITLQDAGALRRVVDTNAWMNDLSGTNLYRGAMVRLGPLLYAQGQKGRDAWDGRLVDYLATRLLDGRPARLAYVDARGLVSPFGLTLPSLTAPQRETVKLLLAGLRSGPDVEMSLSRGESGPESVAVTPLQVKLQRLAAVANGGCLVVARDPLVAASLSLRCRETPPSKTPAAVLPAGRLDVDLTQLFPAGSVVMTKLLGIEGSLRADFDFDPKAARYVPVSAVLPLAPGSLVREAPLDEAVVGALPAATLFFGSLSVPNPGALDLASLETYLRTARETPPPGARTITIASLGTRHEDGPDRHDEPLTAVLLPGAADGAPGLETLFTHSAKKPVAVSTACPGLLVLSRSDAAIASIEAACSGKAPSLRQLPPLLLSRLTKGPAAGAVYLNVGRLLASALDLGWTRRGPQRGEPPPEVSTALELLDRLPSYAFSGRVEGNALRMRAATHSPAAPAVKAGGRKS